MEAGVGSWGLGAGVWKFAAVGWEAQAGCHRLGAGTLEAGAGGWGLEDWRLEVCSCGLEAQAGGHRLEAGTLEAGAGAGTGGVKFTAVAWKAQAGEAGGLGRPRLGRRGFMTVFIDFLSKT